MRKFEIEARISGQTELGTDKYTGSSETILNGRPVRGRTYRHDDGTYESYDLMEASVGDVVTIMKDGDMQEIIKTEGDDGASAMENWELPSIPERGLGSHAIHLTLLEPNASGSSFLTPGVVLREGLEVGYTEVSDATRMKSMGIIGGIAVLTESERQMGSTIPDHAQSA